MSYIAAFHCKTGIVMCGDTQETIGDYKNYVEKISIVEDLSYPLALGGAGFGELIDASTDEIIEQAKKSKPQTKVELKSLVKEALRRVYQEELPNMVVPKQHRTPRLLVAARTAKDGFCILPTLGQRVLKEVGRAVIGYQTAYNEFLLKRFHRESLSMQQAVMLAVYLVMRSKALDEGVGGETRVAVVVDNGAWIDDPGYIANSETRVRDFLRLIDGLFLNSIDISTPPTRFLEQLEEFRRNILQLRDGYLHYSAARSIDRTFRDPNYKGDPYNKIFLGALVSTVFNGTLSVREQTPEEIQRFTQVMELARQNKDNAETYGELDKLLAGRQILFIGKEKVTIHPKSGST